MDVNLKTNEITAKEVESTAKQVEATVKSMPNVISGTTLPFISIKRENLNLFKDSIKKIGNDTVLLFDIDDTLYKSSEELEHREINSYMGAYEKLRQLSVDKAIPTLDEALKESGLFTEIFRKYFNVSPRDIELIRDHSNFADYIKRDDELIEFIVNLPQRKWCFTNGLKSRAMPILKILGLLDCFEGVIGFDDDAVEIIGKPKDNAYEFVEELLGIENKEKVYFFDDAPSNIETGKKFGWKSVLVRKEDDLIDLVKKVLNN